MDLKQIARGLGWAGIGLGLTEIAIPRRLNRFIGIGDGQNMAMLRILGIREVMQGVDILSHRDPTPGVWARVAGDVLDVAVLGTAATKTRRPAGTIAALALVLGISALDVFCAQQLHKQRQSWTRRLLGRRGSRLARAFAS